MMITMLPLSAVTAFAFTVDTSWSHDPTASYNGYKYAYRVNDGNATITKFLGPVDSEGNVDSTIHGPYDIEIPSELGNCPVTGLGEYSFAGSSILDDNYSDPLCRNIHSVTIPQSVTFIGREAFFKCDGLQSLTINGAIVSMSYKAFGNCTSLTTLKLGEHIKTIGGDAFSGCSALKNVTIPENVTSIGSYAFAFSGLESLTINGAIESMGNEAFFKCENLKTLKLGEHIKTIGDSAFKECSQLREVTIPDSVTSIYSCAFCECTSLTTLSLGKNIEAIYENAFNGCSNLSTITIPEKVTTIYYGTFEDCSILKSITLPAGLTSFQDSLNGCPDDCAIYYNNYKTAADALLASNDALAERNFLYLCKVTFNANGGSLNDDADVPVYKTEKITKTEANDRDPINAPIHDPTRAGYTFTGWYTEKNQSENDQPFNVNETAITEDITLYAGWKFDPNALGCHPLTVTGGTVTVKYDGSDVTSTLNSRTDAATGQKTYDVPEGAKVTVKLDKNTVHNGKVFDGWSTGTLSLPTGQDYKAETITFPMSSGVDIAAQYRDAATDHTPDTDTAVCHPLTVTGGIVTVKKGDKDVTDTLTVTTDETTGKKTYSVPDGAEVTVTLDKTLIPEGMVFDIWSTGKFSLPLGQDYKAETITFTMSSDADIAAQYRDATIEDDGPNVLGTAAIIGTAAVGTAVLGYQAYSLGAEFAGKLMALPYFPSNRSALAMMLWEDAGKPMPESELLYPDVGQEEQDMDLQHAARWAMENELIPDLNDEGTAPEEMKFFPANPVSKLDVLNAWQKAQELKNN